MMKRILKTIFCLILTATLLVTVASPCLAEDKKGKITVNLEDKDKNKIDGVGVSVCQIANFNGTGYDLTKSFENSGISLSGILSNPNEASAKSVADFVKKNNTDSLSGKSEKGKVVFADVELGIWLVSPKDVEEYTFNPYFVFLPFRSEDKLYYEISSVPKLSKGSADEINIYVVKRWDDKNDAAKKRPTVVSVELLDGKNVIAEITLSAENAWSHTFSSLPKSESYSVREKKVADYKVTYSGDSENGFIITNTYSGGKLPHTGQYWIPIIIISVAGVAFVLLGIYELGVKRNGKKK